SSSRWCSRALAARSARPRASWSTSIDKTNREIPYPRERDATLAARAPPAEPHGAVRSRNQPVVADFAGPDVICPRGIRTKPAALLRAGRRKRARRTSPAASQQSVRDGRGGVMSRNVGRAKSIGPLTVGKLALACASALGAGAAAAQQSAATPDEEVVVTGSRIRPTGFSTPTPVTVVSSDELEAMAPGTMIEAVTQLPIFFNNTTQDAPGNFFNSPGSGSLNIRGLNTNRTLTLLNGRRMAPSNRVGAVDINAFPEEIVE